MQPFIKPDTYGPWPAQVILIYRTAHYKGPEPEDRSSARLADGFKIVNVGMDFEWNVHVTSDTVKHNIKIIRNRLEQIEFPPLSGNYISVLMPDDLYSFSFDTKDQNIELREVENWDTELPTNTHYPAGAGEEFGTIVVYWENEIMAGIMEEEGVSRYTVADFGYQDCGETMWGPFYKYMMHKFPARLVAEDGLVLENWEWPEYDGDSKQDNLELSQDPELFEELNPAFQENAATWEPDFLDEALVDKEQQRHANRTAISDSEAAWNDLRRRALRGDVEASSYWDLINYFPAPASEEFSRKSEGFNPDYLATESRPDGIPNWVYQLGYDEKIIAAPDQEFTHSILISQAVIWRRPWHVNAYAMLHDWITSVINEKTKPKIDQATGEITMHKPDRIADMRAEQRKRTNEVTGSNVQLDSRDHDEGIWWSYQRCRDRSWALATRLAWHDLSVDPMTYDCETGR